MPPMPRVGMSKSCCGSPSVSNIPITHLSLPQAAWHSGEDARPKPLAACAGEKLYTGAGLAAPAASARHAQMMQVQ